MYIGCEGYRDMDFCITQYFQKGFANLTVYGVNNSLILQYSQAQ